MIDLPPITQFEIQAGEQSYVAEDRKALKSLIGRLNKTDTPTVEQAAPEPVKKERTVKFKDFDVPSSLMKTIKSRADNTSISTDYFLNLAARESSFRTDVSASSSGAVGLYQFIPSTWRNLSEEDPILSGLDEETLLSRRTNPSDSTDMAIRLSEQNANIFTNKIGRPPTEAELYSLHFLGAGTGTDFARKAEENPNRQAAQDFKERVTGGDNRNVFFKPSGEPKTYKEIMSKMIKDFSDKPIQPTPEVPQPKPNQPIEGEQDASNDRTNSE